MKLLAAMNEAGVKPELECFDSGHTHGSGPSSTWHLEAPLQYSFIVNVLGHPPLVESLQLQSKLVHPGSEWEVIGISHGHWRMLAAALVLGGNIRPARGSLYLRTARWRSRTARWSRPSGCRTVAAVPRRSRRRARS